MSLFLSLSHNLKVCVLFESSLEYDPVFPNELFFAALPKAFGVFLTRLHPASRE